MHLRAESTDATLQQDSGKRLDHLGGSPALILAADTSQGITPLYKRAPREATENTVTVVEKLSGAQALVSRGKGRASPKSPLMPEAPEVEMRLLTMCEMT
jgi:hypothetical protein